MYRLSEGLNETGRRAMGGGEVGKEEVPVAMVKVQNEVLTTEEKRANLRKWVLEVSGSDPTRMPTVREARMWARESFGDAPGAGMGTDVITKALRELRAELVERKLGAAAQVGHIEAPTAMVDQMAKIGQIAKLMMDAGLTSLSIDADGAIQEMKRSK
jgi:hypothetical protein